MTTWVALTLTTCCDRYMESTGKNIKWWHRIFFGMLDMAIVNSFLIYRESTGSSLTQFEFRRDLARAMLSFSTRSCSGVKRRKVEYSIPVSVRTAWWNWFHQFLCHSSTFRDEDVKYAPKMGYNLVQYPNVLFVEGIFSVTPKRTASKYFIAYVSEVHQLILFLFFLYEYIRLVYLDKW